MLLWIHDRDLCSRPLCMFYRMDHCHITRSCGISHWTYIHRHSIDADFLLLGMQIGKQSGRCLIATFCETEDIFPLNLRRRGEWRESFRELSTVKGMKGKLLVRTFTNATRLPELLHGAAQHMAFRPTSYSSHLWTSARRCNCITDEAKKYLIHLLPLPRRACNINLQGKFLNQYGSWV